MMRWESAPVVFAAAGALGGGSDAVLSQALIGRYGDEVWICSFIGGGIGLGIGAALSISKRVWVNVVAAPFLGVAGYMSAMSLYALISHSKLPALKHLLEDGFALYLAAIAAPVLVVAHGRYLALPPGKAASWAAPALYLVFGALSGSVFWWKMEDPFVHVGPFLVGLLDGALYGLVQHAGMIVIRRLESWRIVA